MKKLFDILQCQLICGRQNLPKDIMTIIREYCDEYNIPDFLKDIISEPIASTVDPFGLRVFIKFIITTQADLKTFMDFINKNNRLLYSTINCMSGINKSPTIIIIGFSNTVYVMEYPIKMIIYVGNGGSFHTIDEKFCHKLIMFMARHIQCRDGGDNIIEIKNKPSLYETFLNMFK